MNQTLVNKEKISINQEKTLQINDDVGKVFSEGEEKKSEIQQNQQQQEKYNESQQEQQKQEVCSYYNIYYLS